MKPDTPSILTINGGSSSIKFAVYQTCEPLKRTLYGVVDRIAMSGATLTFHLPATDEDHSQALDVSDHESAAAVLLDWFEHQHVFDSVQAVGHRVVHGSFAGVLELTMTIIEPERLSLEKLRGLASAAPPCISIVLPEREARDARIAFKDALTRVRAKLEASVPKRDIASLLDPLELAAEDVIDPSKEPATFIFLRSPDVCESFRTRYLVGPPLAAVGECFQLRPLLALASRHLEFYILALQLNDTRIFKCTDQFCEAARFPKNAGTGAAGFVPGASQASLRAEPVHDHEHPEDHLRHYYREIDRDVNALLKDGHPPLVVVGIEREVALFHRLTTTTGS